MAAGTIDFTAGTASAYPASNTLNPFFVSKTVNFADLVTAKGAALETNEVIKVISVPAGMLVTNVIVKVITAGVGTGSLIATVGDGDDPDGFDTSVDLEAAAGTVTRTTAASVAGTTHGDGVANVFTDAYAGTGGKYYSAADTIDLVLTDYDTVTVNPVIKVTAVCTLV